MKIIWKIHKSTLVPRGDNSCRERDVVYQLDIDNKRLAKTWKTHEEAYCRKNWLKNFKHL